MKNREPGSIKGFWLAITYANVGENDNAFALLNQLFSRRDDRMVNISSAPLLEPLRADPRYFDLLNRLGLPG